MATQPLQILLAQPRGFCAGVERAIDSVERALARFGAPLHVFHEIVHNRQVVDDLRGRGVVFVNDVAQVPRGEVLVFSAHGVADSVLDAAQARGLRVIDATCPLVSKVHQQVRQYSADGRRVILIGQAGHDEVEGTRGVAAAEPLEVVGSAADIAALNWPADTRAAYVTQTTLSIDDTAGLIDTLRQRWPDLQGPNTSDICYASQNRQFAVRALARQVDAVLVVGARHSANAARLREVAEQAGVPAWLIEHVGELNPAWLDGLQRVGITAAASTPPSLVDALCDRLVALGASAPRALPGEVERVRFRLPAGLDTPALPEQPRAPPRLHPGPPAVMSALGAHQSSSNSQAGAPIAAQATSSTLDEGDTSAWNRRSKVAAK
ncbi:4-hydroxy-3-methylbut-2-enyl diphosphate reductase [Ideonella sp. 4Y11]|uniref:4-hydroxy-3-methylbut-2-enyl diphosphate reductase n=1 Tax=Ideonella aquatica TaxID=2824119 RepID=A0A941BL25_9BURK|nr:4-hydroxy-3-methylbut-2-enyl diphosphate reductase [Ideonella aquatica]